MRLRSWILVALACGFAACARSQGDPKAQAAAAALVAAVNAKDPKLLAPVLSEQCSCPGQTPQEFSPQLTAVVSGWTWQVVAHRCRPTWRNRFVVTLVAANGGELEVPMRLDNEGKIVALALFKPVPPETPLVFTGPKSTVLSLVRYGDGWAVRAKAGNEEGLWLVDNGASQLVVDSGAFPLRRYPSIGTSNSTSVTGAQTASDDCDIDTFVIGTQVAAKVRARRHDLAHLTGHDQESGKPVPLLGLIGARELMKFEIRFDFDAATLTLVSLDEAGAPTVPRPPALTERHDFELRLHMPLLRFTAGETTLALAFDTGAGSNVLHERYAADSALTLDNVATESLVGTSPDKPPVKVANVGGLRIGGHAVPPMKTVFFARMAVDGTDGIVGMRWVAGRPFALNYAQKCIVLGARRDAEKPR